MSHVSSKNIPRVPFLTELIKRVASPFALVHSDIWGTSCVVWRLDYQYFVTFIGNFSRSTWIFLMKNRLVVFTIFQTFCSEINTQFDSQIKILQSDDTSEYLSTSFQSLLTSQGILHQPSCSHTPQLNVVAKWKNLHLVETTRSMLLRNNVPLRFWGDTILIVY